MAAPVKTSMPDDVTIGAAFTLRVAALDAATGNAVAGVNLSNFTLEVESIAGGGGAELESGVFMLVPGPGA